MATGQRTAAEVGPLTASLLALDHQQTSGGQHDVRQPDPVAAAASPAVSELLDRLRHGSADVGEAMMAFQILFP